MDKEIEITDEKIEAIGQMGDAGTNLLNVGMRDLTLAARAAMNQKLASGEGYFRLTTEVSSTGMHVAAAFVTEQTSVPILDIYIGNSDEELDHPDAKHWTH